MEINDQDAAEFAAFKAAKAAKEAAENKRNQTEKYKEMVEEEILATMPELRSLSEQIEIVKRTIFENWSTVIEMKQELFKVDTKQMTHSFSSKDGKYRLIMGYNTVDSYGDTVNEGIAMVREYIASLADSPKTAILVDTIMKLLSRNQNGELKASRVMQLRQMAERTGNERFMEGVKIIEDAYNPSATKQFIRAMIRDERTNEYVTLPLSVTDARIKEEIK